MREVKEVVKLFTPEEIKEYLDRIGMPPVEKPTKEALDEMIYRQQCSLAFENLDSFDLHKEVSLDPDYVFQKIIRGKRGGYCLELNALFYRLLLSLGYDARLCFVRVLLGSDDFTTWADHRAIIVTLDGVEYFCDGGLGGPMPAGAINIQTDEWQTCKKESFRVMPSIKGWYEVHRKTRISQQLGKLDAAQRIEILFSDVACFMTDFIFLNYYQSTNKDARFCSMRVVNIRTEDGYRTIVNDEYKEVSEDNVIIEPVGGRLKELLKEKFDIEIEL